jgi:ceramide glucosyltransferase
MTPTHYLLLVPVVLAVLFWWVTTFCVARFMRPGTKVVSNRETNGYIPLVSLLKPVCGLEKNLYDNLKTACVLDYPNYEVIFTLQSDLDPALMIVEKIKAEFPQAQIRIVVDSHQVGVNGKVNNLYNALLKAKGEVIVISDSDMHLDADYLDHIVAPLAHAHNGIVCTLYQARRPVNILEALELLTYNSDFVPSMLFAYLSRTSIVCPGATLAIRKDVLEEIGGLVPLSDYFVEDFEMGRRVVEKGYRIHLVPYIAKMDLDLTRPMAWWRHQVYWDQNTKTVNAPGFFFTLLVRGIPFALLYMLMGGPYGWLVVAGSVGFRILTGLINALCLRDTDGLKQIWLLPIRDLLGMVVWLVSLFKRRTHWRGNFYTVKKGKMVPVQ